MLGARSRDEILSLNRGTRLIYSLSALLSRENKIIRLLLLQQFYIAPLQDCLLRRAPSPASVKHNGLKGREEGDGVINRHLVKSDRKPIPGHRASNRKGAICTL